MIRSSDVPQINVVGVDKLVHLMLHLLFVFFWGIALVTTSKLSLSQVIGIVFLLSFFFGIGIEFMQAYFTTTRSADYRDVLANVFGALIGLSLLKSFQKHFTALK